MKFTEEFPDSGYVIQSYRDDLIVINSVTYTASLILSPQKLIADWPPSSISNLTAIHFEALLAGNPEVMILGTGANLVFPPADVTAAVINRNIGLEIMDTGAACRTYNILASENRNVIAGLILPEGK